MKKRESIVTSAYGHGNFREERNLSMAESNASYYCKIPWVFFSAQLWYAAVLCFNIEKFANSIYKCSESSQVSFALLQVIFLNFSTWLQYTTSLSKRREAGEKGPRGDCINGRQEIRGTLKSHTQTKPSLQLV